MNELYDSRAVFQVLGCLIKQPDLLEQYKLTSEDFCIDFHELLFSAINNLYYSGVKTIDKFSIDSYLSQLPTQYKIFEDNEGLKYIDNCVRTAELENFAFNFNCVKKRSLCRYYEDAGLDVCKLIYNYKEIDPTQYEQNTIVFNNLKIEDIIAKIELIHVINPKLKFSENNGVSSSAGDGIDEVVEDGFKDPEIGLPMQSKYMNTIFGGARLKTVFVRSGSTGSGKTKLSLADTCNYSIPWFYDTRKRKWIYTGFNSPSLIITAELSKKAIQQNILAYMSGVNISHIKNAKLYEDDEYERITQAKEYLKSAPLLIEECKDFNIEDIVNIIKRAIRLYGVTHVNFDYLHTTIKLMMELSNKTKGARLREDQMLFFFADTLKNLADTENIHIDTATQLNDKYEELKYKDQTCLRGAKSIPDRFDGAWIAMPISSQELEAIQPILEKGYYPEVTKQNGLVYHVYKNRDGGDGLVRIKVFLVKDLGTCRTIDLFCTTYDNEYIPVEKLTINSKEREELEEKIAKNIDDMTDEEIEEAKIAYGIIPPKEDRKPKRKVEF